MDLITSPVDAAKGVAVGAGVGIGSLVALPGIVMAVATKDVTQVVTPLMATVKYINLLITVVRVVRGPESLVIGSLLALLALWAVGSKQQAAPAWALPDNVRNGEGEPITPSIVVKALRDLGVASLRTAIKDVGDAGAGMLGPIRIAGCGVEVDVTLPSGVSTIEVQSRRREARGEPDPPRARGVHHHPAGRPATVRLWVADSGALDEPIGPSPLVTDETLKADYAKGRAHGVRTCAGTPRPCLSTSGTF